MTSIVIEMNLDQRRRIFGGGMNVGRVPPFVKRRMAGPFILSDHTGPLDLAAIDQSVDATTATSEASRP